jgi:hypothetical protein
MGVLKATKIGTTGTVKKMGSTQGPQQSHLPSGSSYSNAGMKRGSRSSSPTGSSTKPNWPHMPGKPK